MEFLWRKVSSEFVFAKRAGVTSLEATVIEGGKGNEEEDLSRGVD